MTENKESDIYYHLIEIGCCKLCSIRYTGYTRKEYYTNFDLFLKENNINSNNTDNLSESKKFKENVCIACLGLLQHNFITKLLDYISNNSDIEKYDSLKFACAISLPIAQQLRAHSINLYLKEKYSSFFNKDDNAEIPLKEVWKWVLTPKINNKLSKEVDNGANCDFLITINFQYIDEEKELNSLLKMSPNVFKVRNKDFKKYRGEMFTRKGVETLLTEVDEKVFKEYVSCPPTIPNQTLNFSSISCSHNSIYLAGRYNKYSRSLSQTPWIVNGKRLSEGSVQEIICCPLGKYFNFSLDNIKFIASGREDCDVRCLGNGRPFVLEIINPKKTRFTEEELKQVELEINNSRDIRILSLQLVPKCPFVRTIFLYHRCVFRLLSSLPVFLDERDDLGFIKQGEEEKTKVYQALCVSQQSLKQSQLDELNSIKDLVLQQKTPIRVLHRRPLATRPRMIHYIKGQLLPGNGKLFTVDVQTQAGTYVKEFVHGDFGRTKPSLSSLLDVEVDIIALDVTCINLEWPKCNK